MKCYHQVSKKKNKKKRKEKSGFTFQSQFNMIEELKDIQSIQARIQQGVHALERSFA